MILLWYQRPTIEVSVSEMTAVVTLNGEHDISTATQLRVAVAELENDRDLIVDLSGATFVDSAIMSVLVHAAELWEHGDQAQVVVAPVGSFPRTALDLAGVSDLLQLAEARDATEEFRCARVGPD